MIPFEFSQTIIIIIIIIVKTKITSKLRMLTWNSFLFLQGSNPIYHQHIQILMTSRQIFLVSFQNRGCLETINQL